jgi:hypothetical protein
MRVVYMSKSTRKETGAVEVSNEVQELLNSQQTFAACETANSDDDSSNNDGAILDAEVEANAEMIADTIVGAIFTEEQLADSAQTAEGMIEGTFDHQSIDETKVVTSSGNRHNYVPESQGLGVGYKIVHKVGYNGVDRNGILHRDGLHIVDLKTGRLYNFTLNEFKRVFNYSKTATRAKRPDVWAELKPGITIDEVITSKDNTFKNAVAFNVSLICEGSLNEVDAVKKLMGEHGRNEREVLEELSRQGYSLRRNTDHINPLN